MATARTRSPASVSRAARASSRSCSPGALAQRSRTASAAPVRTTMWPPGPLRSSAVEVRRTGSNSTASTPPYLRPPVRPPPSRASSRASGEGGFREPEGPPRADGDPVQDVGAVPPGPAGGPLDDRAVQGAGQAQEAAARRCGTGGGPVHQEPYDLHDAGGVDVVHLAGPKTLGGKRFRPAPGRSARAGRTAWTVRKAEVRASAAPRCSTGRTDHHDAAASTHGMWPLT